MSAESVPPTEKKFKEVRFSLAELEVINEVETRLNELVVSVLAVRGVQGKPTCLRVHDDQGRFIGLRVEQ